MKRTKSYQVDPETGQLIGGKDATFNFLWAANRPLLTSPYFRALRLSDDESEYFFHRNYAGMTVKITHY